MTCSERPLAQPSKAGRLAGSYDVPLPGPHCSRTRGAAQCSRALALAATLASLRETPSGAARFRGRCLLPRAVPRPGHHQIILSLAVARARCHVGLGKGRCGGKRGGRDSEGRCRAQRGPEAGFAALDRSWWTKCSCPLYGYSLRYTVPPSAWTTGTWKGRGSGSGSSVSTLDGRRPIPLGSAYGSRWASSCCGPALREPVSVEKWRKERNPTVLLQHAMAEAEGLSVRANASQSFIGACGPRSVMRPSPRRAAAAADDAGLRRGRHGGQDPLPPHRHLQIADSGRLHEAHVRIERVPRPGGHVQVDAEVGDCPPPAATARCAAVLTPRCRTRHEGVRGLYRGFPVAFWGSGPAACIYFTSYEVRRAVLALTPPHAVERWHSFSRDASAADQGLPLARPGHRRPRLRPPLCRRYGGRVDQVRPAPRALGGLWGRSLAHCASPARAAAACSSFPSTSSRSGCRCRSGRVRGPPCRRSLRCWLRHSSTHSCAWPPPAAAEGAAGTYYRSVPHALRTIAAREGISGIYKARAARYIPPSSVDIRPDPAPNDRWSQGYWATLLSFGPFSGLHFLFYEKLKGTAQRAVGSARPEDMPFLLSMTRCAARQPEAPHTTLTLTHMHMQWGVRWSRCVIPHHPARPRQAAPASAARRGGGWGGAGAVVPLPRRVGWATLHCPQRGGARAVQGRGGASPLLRPRYCGVHGRLRAAQGICAPPRGQRRTVRPSVWVAWVGERGRVP